MTIEIGKTKSPIWDAEWVEGDWEIDFSGLVLDDSNSRQDSNPGCSETTSSKDHDHHVRRTVSLAAETSTSKAIATGHKRFQEWKLRRRGSTNNSSNRRRPHTETPVAGLASNSCGSAKQRPSDGNESDKENWLRVNRESGPEDSSVEDLQVSYAAMTLAPYTPSSPDSTAHHVAACVEHLVDREINHKSSGEIKTEEMLSQVLDKSAPVKWKLSLPIWPITVELAVDVKRTVSDSFPVPTRVVDPELGEGNSISSAERSPTKLLERWYDALEFDFGFSDVEAPA